jgi:hypothetical protein
VQAHTCGRLKNYQPHACQINTLRGIDTILRVDLTRIREDSTGMRAGSTRMHFGPDPPLYT